MEDYRFLQPIRAQATVCCKWDNLQCKVKCSWLLFSLHELLLYPCAYSKGKSRPALQRLPGLIGENEDEDEEEKEASIQNLICMIEISVAGH